MACPETTTLGRFVGGRLSPSEIATLEEHLDECEDCFVKVSALAAQATGESPTISGEPPDPAMRQEFAGAIEALGYPHRTAEEPPPTKIGRYLIEGILGQGAMGVVYRARDPETGRGLAIKTVHDAKAPVMSSLRQEIAFLRGSRHRGVVEILDYDLIGRHPWYAMELLEGETLADRNTAIWKDVIGEQGQHPGGKKPMSDAACGRLGEVLGFFHRLCEPLSFLHRAGVVHCRR
jgi:serine/threonine-protein kinase